MITVLICLIISSAMLYQLAMYYENKPAKFILKPGTMLLIIFIAIYGSKLDTVFSIWVVVALILSLFGDVFLMLNEKWFLYGLKSFLIAHIFYIIGFWDSFELDYTSDISILVGVVLFVFAISFFIVLFPSVKKYGGILLTVAVALYICIISTMVWSALLIEIKSILIASTFFYISDAVLALNRFKRSFASAEYIVMFTYFSAQLLFALCVI